MIMDIWEVGTLNQLSIRGSYTEKKFFQKDKVVRKLFFVIGQFFTPHSIAQTLSSDRVV